MKKRRKVKAQKRQFCQINVFVSITTCCIRQENYAIRQGFSISLVMKILPLEKHSNTLTDKQKSLKIELLNEWFTVKAERIILPEAVISWFVILRGCDLPWFFFSKIKWISTKNSNKIWYRHKVLEWILSPS